MYSDVNSRLYVRSEGGDEDDEEEEEEKEKEEEDEEEPSEDINHPTARDSYVRIRRRTQPTVTYTYM